MSKTDRFMANLSPAEQKALVLLILRAFVRNDQTKIAAMTAVLVDGKSVSDVSAQFHINRRTLKRQLDDFRINIAAAAEVYDACGEKAAASHP